MKVRIISGVVGGILAILILILHKTFVFPLAIAALICIALFELFRAGKCLHCRISIGAGFLYGAALPFLQYYCISISHIRIPCLLPQLHFWFPIL